MITNAPNAEYSFTASRRQLFAFPPDVISCLLGNPSSPEGLAKIYQTCKYFFAKRPILIVDKVKFRIDDYDCENEDDNSVHDIFFSLKNGCFQKVPDLTTPIWFTNTIILCGYSIKRLCLPKNLFRLSINTIELKSHIQFQDLVLLNSGKKIQSFIRHHYHCRVYHADRSDATVEEILSVLPNIRNFDYYYSDINNPIESLTKLNDIKFNNKFEFFKLDIYHMRPPFDMNLFCKFIAKISSEKPKLFIHVFQHAEYVLKISLQNLDPKWKTKEIHDGLKEFLGDLNPDWKKEQEN